jgi:AcrR family transcriptional regulator
MIAEEVGMATGTMFNYFPTKEAVVVELASVALEKARADYAKNRREQAELAEDLFSCVAAQLRAMNSMRKYVRPLLETALTPGASQGDSLAVKTELFEQFEQIIMRHHGKEASAVAMNIWWALYVGVLSFWGQDKSPKNEDSIALLDESTNMFVGWLEG